MSSPLASLVPSERLDIAERQVPRYTSYPTAPHFSPAVDAATYRGWLAELSASTSLSLYLHVPFCQSICTYCGCNTKAVRREEPILDYRQRLVEEVHLVADMTEARQIHHIHWGGGTPSMLGLAGLAEVTEALARRFSFAEGAEHAIELDPRHVSPELAHGLAGFGVNRASLGVQDLNPHVQQAIGRIQPYETVAATVEALRGAGIEAISMDLMYGLPHQKAEDLLNTIGRVCALRPDRIALFGYAHVPWFKSHQKLIDESALPDAAARFAQAEIARDALVAEGYEAIGLDHFARPHDEMAEAARTGRLKRNFQGYSTDEAEALIGLGASAIGRLPQGYVQNAPDVAGYKRAIDAGMPATVRGLALSEEDRVRAAVIEGLMCRFQTDLDEVADQFGITPGLFDPDLAELMALERQGLVARDGRRVTVLEAGRPFVRVVASVFDAHLAKAGRHSAAV